MQNPSLGKKKPLWVGRRNLVHNLYSEFGCKWKWRTLNLILFFAKPCLQSQAFVSNLLEIDTCWKVKNIFMKKRRKY